MTPQRSTDDPGPVDVNDPWEGADLDRLYEQYGKPLEAEHWGEYLAISPDGRTMLAPTDWDALTQSAQAFGPGNLIFKVGERWVFELR
jgi:hypothetical protein